MKNAHDRFTPMVVRPAGASRSNTRARVPYRHQLAGPATLVLEEYEPPSQAGGRLRCYAAEVIVAVIIAALCLSALAGVHRRPRRR